MEIEEFSINCSNCGNPINYDVAKIENEISKSIELYKKATMNESSDGNIWSYDNIFIDIVN